jgi:hypothetical protein
LVLKNTRRKCPENHRFLDPISATDMNNRY